MKIDRTANAGRNIFYGVILKAYQVLVPFIMRTVMLYLMGVQYLGLGGLFTSIISVLNLTELGVGSAMVFSMYKPIAEDDSATICALMKRYRTYYRYIGLLIAVIGGAITPFVPYLIKGSVPDGLNVYILYLLNLAVTVLSYWLFAYRNSILLAHQRTDISSKVQIVCGTAQYVLEFLVLLLFRNYYLYIVIGLGMQAVRNVVTAVISRKLYPMYEPAGELPVEVVRKINGRIRDLFTSRIGAEVVNSVDTIVISAFLGLATLGIYQNYFYVIASVRAFITIVFNSCKAGIGNSLVTESQDKNFRDLEKFTFIIAWIAGFCACCFLTMYQPFITLWTGPDLLLPMSTVICLVIYFYIYEINQLLNTYKDAGGIWHEDRWRPLVTAGANLTMNLLTVRYWGLYGVILSTVVSMSLIGMPWLFKNLFSTMFEKDRMWGYIRSIAVYAASALAACAICFFAVRFLPIENLWISLVVRLVISAVVSNGLFFVLFRKTSVFSESRSLAEKMIRKLAKKR